LDLIGSLFTLWGLWGFEFNLFGVIGSKSSKPKMRLFFRIGPYWVMKHNMRSTWARLWPFWCNWFKLYLKKIVLFFQKITLLGSWFTLWSPPGPENDYFSVIGSNSSAHKFEPFFQIGPYWVLIQPMGSTWARLWPFWSNWVEIDFQKKKQFFSNWTLLGSYTSYGDSLGLNMAILE